MRKFFKILMAIIALLIAAMIITPYLFKDKIKEIVKMEANNYLNARFDFDDVSISLFRAFPKASVAVTNVVIVNNAPFEGDTLLAVKKIMATVDISSLFGNKGIVVNRILLNAPFIQGQVTKEGVTNWDIMKQEENEIEENEIVEKPVNPNENEESLSLSLNEFSIKKARIIYDDRQSDMQAVIKDMDISLSGKLYEDNTLVKTNILIGSLNLIMENVTYINKAELEAGVDLDADFANKKFIFRENFLRFNAIKTSLDGWVSMPDTSSIEMDLKLNTSKINFKEILSLIPAVYAKDFESLKASGSV